MNYSISDNCLLFSDLDGFQKSVISSLPNRIWNAKKSAWEVPICRANIKRLVKYEDFYNCPEIKHMYDKYVEDAVIKKQIPLLEKIPIDFSRYFLKPYRYQEEGIYFCVIGKRAIIADEPGLGKTMQAIIAADIIYSDSGYILVICPRSLVYNWALEINKIIRYIDTDSVREILEKAPIYVASGFSAQEVPSDKKWVVCGYSQFTPRDVSGVKKTWASYFSNMNIDTLILDEAHKVKNPNANRTKNIRILSRRAKNLIMLSGTIMMNSVEELWSPLNMVSENDFNKKNAFCDKFMKSYELKLPNVRFPIKKYYGVKNEDELKKTLSPFIIRRLKKDVLPQIPPKRREFLPMELPVENRKEYDEMLREFIDYLINKGELEKAAKASRAVQLVQGMELMKFISSIKAMMAEEIIDEILTVGKCVVFCLYKKTASELYEMFKGRSFLVTGNIDLAKRQSIIEEFKRSQFNDVLIMTYGAGSEGFNLEEASDAVMVDFNWVPAVMLQAEDRIYRMTSQNSVLIRYLYLSNTIDEYIYKLVNSKIESIDKVLSIDKDIINDFAQILTNELKGGKLNV